MINLCTYTKRVLKKLQNLTEKFRLTYGELWQSILKADLPKIEALGRELGLGDLYGLFTCMVTARSWDSIGKGIDRKEITHKEVRFFSFLIFFEGLG